MIVVEKINIQNYRKILDEDIYMDRTLTAIAGSNNAGKTSIVELMSNIFLGRKDSISIEDMNYSVRKKDIDLLECIVNDPTLDNDMKVENIKSVRKSLNKIKVFISVQYDETDSDQLRLFSDYLSDVDIMKRNFYFIVEYRYKSCKESELTDAIERGRGIEELFSSLESYIYYCNETEEDMVLIKNKENFYKLFNYHCVYALRKLSDTYEDKQNFLSKHLLKTVKNHDKWNISLNDLIQDINKLLIDKNLSDKIDEITIDTIKQTLDDFSRTNGGNTGRLGIDFRLENSDIEKVLLEFTKIYFEQDGGGRIKEQKQGLGYSNLIYLLLETQMFKEKLDKEKVNLLVFEEPEAHLHPQMQNIFINYLNNVNSKDVNSSKEILIDGEFPQMDQIKNIDMESFQEVAASSSDELEIQGDSIQFQMFITTHSSEMTKSINLPNIRVLRPSSHVETKVFDLKKFLMSLNPAENAFYSKFFQFNMVEMVFADKLILFEGDAERLLLKYLILNDQKYRNLSSQYISYIQVGGAYAQNYLKMVNFLQIRTLIISDIDYIYEKQDIDKDEVLLVKEILARNTTNKALENITGETKIRNIIKSQMKNKGIYDKSNLVCLKFQTHRDGYARTLEDAILKKMLNKRTVFRKISKTEFSLLIDQYSLQLSGPQKVETSIRDRIDKLQHKTDFIYSLIEHDQIKSSVPSYIEEGLEWLQG
jgi:predicted ATP-dependent endonuclease of OLD family